MTTAGKPWGWFLGHLLLGVTALTTPPCTARPAPNPTPACPASTLSHCPSPPQKPRPRPSTAATPPRAMATPPRRSLAWGGSSRIVNGEDCRPHSQPWQAALFLENEFFCGGVLVHPQWVLSAAHCFQKSYTIGLGLHSLEADQEPGSQMIEAHLSIQHPEYNKPSLANDLMLIKLEESMPPSDTIQDISIASQCPTAGDSCLVSGWGRLVNGRLPKVLQCVNISVVSEKICSELYAHVYHPSMFCAGGGQDQKDSCHGDSGGPLVCNGSLQGLVSFGQARCGQPDVPSVYTNLCKFADWIQKTIQAS